MPLQEQWVQGHAAGPTLISRHFVFDPHAKGGMFRWHTYAIFTIPWLYGLYLLVWMHLRFDRPV